MSSGIYIEIGPWNSPKSVRGIPPNPSVVLPKIRPAFTSKWVRGDDHNRTIRWHQNVAGIVFEFFMKCARNKIATTTPPKLDNREPEARSAYDTGSGMPMWYAKIRELAPGSVIRIPGQK